MSIKEGLIDLAQNPKVASIVSTATTGTGIGTFLDLIPNDIGKLATLVGILLSCVLIYTHLRKGRIEYKKTQLEIELLKSEKKESEELEKLNEKEDEPEGK